jgi:hypothetical protein
VVHGAVSSTGDIKGTAIRDFSLSPKPLFIPLGLVQIFFSISGDISSSRCTTGVVAANGKWKKSSIRKVLNILSGGGKYSED